MHSFLLEFAGERRGKSRFSLPPAVNFEAHPSHPLDLSSPPFPPLFHTPTRPPPPPPRARALFSLLLAPCSPGFAHDMSDLRVEPEGHVRAEAVLALFAPQGRPREGGCDGEQVPADSDVQHRGQPCSNHRLFRVRHGRGQGERVKRKTVLRSFVFSHRCFFPFFSLLL